MIIVSGRRLLIPSGEKHIGFTGDNLVEKRIFAINNKSIFDFEFRVDLKNTGETIIPQKKLSDDGEFLFLKWDITAAVLKNTPMVEFQLRGFEADGERVWHSEKSSFYTSDSVDAQKEITQEELDEFHVLEKQAAVYRNEVQAFASQAEGFCNEAQSFSNEAESFKNAAEAFSNQAGAFAQQSLKDYTELKNGVYTKTETDDKIKSDIASVIVQEFGRDDTKVMSQKAVVELLQLVTEGIEESIDALDKGKADSNHVHTAENVGAYTKAEIDEKFKNLYYTEDVKLTDVTALVSMGIPGELIKDDVLIPVGDGGLAAETLFHIDVNGYIKFHCEIEEGGSLSEINGTLIGGETGIYEYSFEGDVTGGFDVMLTTSSVTFTEFVKKTYVKDAIGNVDTKIGDIDSALDEFLSSKADAEDVYTKEQVDTLLSSKADNDDVYTKDDIDTLLSKKRDNDDFTPIASADKAQETISLVGITTVETSDDENGWEITSNTLSATINPLFSNGAIFHIDFQGNVNLEIDANAFEGAGLHPAEAGYVEIDGIKLTAENVSTSGCKYRYIGDITREITIQANYARYEFTTFIKNIKIYSDGFMSGEQADKIDTLESQIGDIDSALDELHSYAQALIGGEA